MGSGVTSVCEPPEVGVRSSARDAHALKHGVTSPAPDLLIFYVYECFPCMYLCITCVQHPGRPGEDARSPGTGATDGCEPPHGAES